MRAYGIFDEDFQIEHRIPLRDKIWRVKWMGVTYKIHAKNGVPAFRLRVEREDG